MPTTQMISYVAAFLSLALLVVAIGQLTSAFFVRYEKLWVHVQKKNESKIAAFQDLLKQVLAVEGRRLRSIENMLVKLRVDIVRAAAVETPEEYLGQTLFEGLLVFVIAGIACLFLFGPASLVMPLVLALAWVYFVRPSLVEGDAEKRARAIYRRIPYALDLAVLVLQAGGTLREALEVASDRDDPLAQEMKAALKEMDSGATQSAALRNMSNRIGLESLDSIVMAVIRGLETGAPMAQTLATQAELFRERRLQELEKLAVEAPTKMTFPNMLVMLSVLVIILGPVLVKISKSGFL